MIARYGWSETLEANRDSIDLVRVAIDLLGPPPGRRGDKDRGRVWWLCPFHEEENPSFTLDAESGRWYCFGCQEKGDIVSLLMRIKHLTFPEAVKELTGREPARSRYRDWGPLPPPEPRIQLVRKPVRPISTGPSGMEPGPASDLVARAAERLWAHEGASALDGLRRRGLADATIRAAQLGFAPRIEARARDGHPYLAAGIVIPWFGRDGLDRVNVRQPDGRRPKFAEVFRAANWTGGIYPGQASIRPGRPVVIVEGEMDSLLLAQEIAALDVAVVTLGSASAVPDVNVLIPLLCCPTWCIATDRDDAGNKAAERWPARARRASPPELIGQPCKDWTDCHSVGADLLAIWRNILVTHSSTPSWEELSGLRWAGTTLDDTNIVIDHSDHDRARAAMATSLRDVDDPERIAIRAEANQSKSR